MNSELALRPEQAPACLAPGYQFTSRRALLQLEEPLKCLLQMLNVAPLEVPQVHEFMAQRTEELEHPKPLQPRLRSRMAYFALLCLLVAVGAGSFWVMCFEAAWVVSMGLLIPAVLIILRMTRPAVQPLAPAEWCEQNFWAYRKAVRESEHPVPKHIVQTAERIQTFFAGTVLTVVYLYGDAFLCARYETPLGAQEVVVVAHWGGHRFVQ